MLDQVQHWPVFEEVPELFILVPALLGLKVEQEQQSVTGVQGNLENPDLLSLTHNIAGEPGEPWPLVSHT